MSQRRQRARRSHCSHGHPFDKDNTRLDRYGARHCRACDRANARLSHIRNYQRVGRPAFWDRICPEPNTGCWLWTGALNTGGYGCLQWEGRTRTAHRVAWELTHGPTDLCVLHKCDTRPCCNPEHLFLGTKADNNLDRDRKGRTRGGGSPGEAHYAHKLSSADVIAIRESDATERELARRYGVSQSNISHILLRKGWKHV